MKEKIIIKSYIVGIIGIGYTGLLLAIEFCMNNIRVIGFDRDESKIKI